MGYFLAQFRNVRVVAGFVKWFCVLKCACGLLWQIVVSMLISLCLERERPVFAWAAVKLFTGEYTYAALLILYVVTQVSRH